MVESKSNSVGKKRLAVVASVLVSGGILLYLLARSDLGRLGGLLSQANWVWFGGAVAIACCLPLVATVRWLGVLRAGAAAHLPVVDALRAVMMAHVLNTVLPSKGGDLAKALYVRRHVSLSTGLGTVLLERLTDLGVLGLLGVAGSLVAHEYRWGLWGSAALAGAVVFGFTMLAVFPLEMMGEWLPEKLRRAAQEGRQVFRDWARRPLAIVQTVGASFLHWMLAGALVCFLAQAFGGDAFADGHWAVIIGVFPLAILAGLVPWTLQGAGTRDAAFVSLLSSTIGREEAMLTALGYLFCSYWLLAFLGLLFVGGEAFRLSGTRDSEKGERG